MASPLLPFRAFILLWFVAIHAWSCTQEDYWKMKLPKVPMPQQIRDNLLSSIEKTSMTTKFTGLSSIDNKEKITTTQPYTVFSWRYNVDENDKTTITTTNQPGTTKAERNNVDEKEKVTTTQPYTVFSWRYNADEKEKITTTITDQPHYSTKQGQYNVGAKEEVTTTQPYTVFSWRYNAHEKDKTTTIHQPRTIEQEWYNADEKEKVTTTQPYTVFSWRYNADEKEKTTPPTTTTTQPQIVQQGQYDADNKAMVTTTQPYTVFSWRYNADDKERATTTTTTSQPRFLEKERYNADNKKKVTTTQPYTIFGWRYDANSAKQHPIHHNHIKSTEDKAEVDNLSIHTMRDEEMAAGSVFFIEQDLHVGAKLKHDFQKRPTVPLLSSEIAESIPFSMDKYHEILNRFSIKPESAEATIIQETLSICLERPRVKIENRTCAQSMESLVNFVVQELGTNDIKVTMMNNLNKIHSGIKEYVVTKLKKMSTGLDGNSMVTCHRMNYPYVVYYCHHQRAISLFSVTLIDNKGVAVDTSAICHYDTYAWQPNVPALRYLNIQPGDFPVCHFSAATDISWTLNKSDLPSPHETVAATE